MKWSAIISTFFSGLWVSCHAPVLLSELSPESQPKENYKYYNPDFQLSENSNLKTNGFYYNIGTPRKVPIKYENYLEAKKNGIAPAGFDLDELKIHSDTVLTITNTNLIVFYPDGTFVLNIYKNKSLEEIKTDAAKRFKNLKEGWYVYKLENEKIKYEYYSKMSRFNYAEGEIHPEGITFGKSKPYQFIQFY